MCIRLHERRCGVVVTALYILYWEVDSSHRILKRWSTLTFAIVVKLHKDWSNDSDLMDEWSCMQTVIYMRISDILDSDVVNNEALCSWWSVLSLSRGGIRMLEFVCDARLHRSGWGDIHIPPTTCSWLRVTLTYPPSACFMSTHQYESCLRYS